MAEDLDESLLLGDDDEGGHGGDFNEDELLYEGDEDVYGGHGEGEGDDVLDLELGEEELETPDTLGDNGFAPMKVRTQGASQSTRATTTPAASVTSSSENLTSLTPAGSLSTLKSVGDSDDDEESPRQRQRFTTERKTDDLNSGGGGGISTASGVRSIASIGNRGGFRGGRGGFVTRGGQLRQMGPRGMQNQGNMRMRHAPPGAFGQRQRFPGQMHRFPPQNLMPGPEGAGMSLLPFPHQNVPQQMQGAPAIMSPMNQFPHAGLLPPPGSNMQGGPPGMNPNRMHRPRIGPGSPNFPPGHPMQILPNMPPRQFAPPRNQRFPTAGYFPNRQWTPNMPPQGNMPVGGSMEQGFQNYPPYSNGPQGHMPEFGGPQQYNDFHHQQAMNQSYMSNLNPEAPPFMPRLPNGMNPMSIPPGAHINPDFKGPPPVVPKTDEYFSEELFGSPSKDRHRFDRSPDRYDDRRRDEYRYERSPDRYEKSRRGGSYDRDRSRSRSPSDRYDSRRGDSYRRSPESRYRDEGRRYSPDRERYRDDYRDDYERSRRRDRGYDDDFGSDGRRTVVNRTVRARSRSKSPHGGERKLQGRLGPPVKDEPRQNPKATAISKESQSIVGVDDQYLRKLEEQKEVRARVLREKEARRRKQLGQDEEPELQKQQSPKTNPFLAKPAVVPSRGPGEKTATKVFINPNALKGSASSTVRIPSSVAAAATQGGQKVRKILRIVRNKKGEIIEKKKVLILPKASAVGGSSTRVPVPTTTVK